jgi:serine protease AprX
MKKTILCLLLVLIVETLRAQTCVPTQRYFVYFQDKDWRISPEGDFDGKALQRRVKCGIPFPMAEDYPVNPTYAATVGGMVTQPRHTLRWFNALSVEATAAEMEAVKKLPFVREVQPFEELEVVLAEAEEWEAWENLADKDDSLEYHTLLNHQREMVAMQLAEEMGLSGKGLRIAVFDAGFTGVDEHPGFAHLREKNLIKLTKDFVSGDADVYAHSGHGTAVLGCITGMYEGKRLGAAVDAEFLLARTERNLRETPSEEDNWLAAMEWADREGADLISSSLGYARPRYKYADMDGRKTLVSRAAAMAVRKGILVVNSAGNEGANEFRYIAAPSDADSVLTVAASYPMVRMKMPFSSVGPNARGLLKPEIATPGFVLTTHKKGGFKTIGGTSFACPMMAGLAACLMEYYPDSTNMEIKRIILESGHTYPYYDYALGYGVFSMTRAMMTDTFVDETFRVEVEKDTTWFTLDPEVVNRDTLNQRNGKPLNYRFIHPNGRITSYKTILVRKNYTRFGIGPQQRTPGALEVWFEGYLWKEE